MSALDPEDVGPAGPQDSQSSDQSKSGLRQAWDAWTGRPENNAALLQFGIAMLQPHAPGQSSLGAAANALGEAGQASERNVAGQAAEEERLASRSIKEREAGSREVTAQAYADQVSQGKAKVGGLQGRIATQRAFNQWLNKPTDETGMTSDPIVKALQRSFPDVKSKADLLANPQALAAARRLYETSLAEPDEDTGAAPAASPPGGVAPPAAAAPAAPAAAPGRPVYNKASGALAGYWYPDKGFVPLAK